MSRLLLGLLALLLFLAGGWWMMPRSSDTPGVGGRTGSGTSVYRAEPAAPGGAPAAPGAKFVTPPAPAAAPAADAPAAPP
ncbi:MAG: hypothetical protein N2Z62_14070 [Rhodobacteraceae bacterium]|nr:hypothetical protein [Paracoccaceae bacterium]